MQWHCSFGELVRRVDELRASWSEAVLRELFAEAARLAAGERRGVWSLHGRSLPFGSPST